MKLTENEVVRYLSEYLKRNDWSIVSFCLGQTHGVDIVAEKEGQVLLIEAKGARANDIALTKKREKFNAGQIKSHYGVAIIKAIELKKKNPSAIIAIAQPLDMDIKKAIGDIASEIEKLGIKHIWVEGENSIEGI